jgi:magnesium transporter
MPVIQQSNRIYFRDVYDHLYRIYEMSETYRDIIAGTMEVYMSLSANEQAESSHRMNRVIKTLTVVATVMMPPTLISGIYGMNFAHIPELNWPFGYLFALGIMLMVSLGMILFLKKKNWI